MMPSPHDSLTSDIWSRDTCPARNLNLLCKFSLVILRQQNDKLSLKASRWKCSLQLDYLKEVLGF